MKPVSIACFLLLPFWQAGAQAPPPQPTDTAKSQNNEKCVLAGTVVRLDTGEPLKKATELDPKNAQAWYLLGACMVADPSIYKTVGSKIEVTPRPGTIEAYQKAIDLDPNGPWGTEKCWALRSLAAAKSRARARLLALATLNR